ncbi:MAG: alpha-keto acid decarboxylase family protein [Phycisphaerae bacterium]
MAKSTARSAGTSASGVSAPASTASAKTRAAEAARARAKPAFPATMPMGQFLFAYLEAKGVRHSFGVPGDFALPTFAWLEKSNIESITMVHEPGAGFAADAYARLNGIGLVMVTYCVGGLNVLNAIAGAYAEKSPVVVVSGAPGRRDRETDPLLHHKVKTFDTQRRVYEEVTVANTVLLDENTAAGEIVRVVEACLKHKRPVYIEVPHDMVDRPIPTIQPEAYKPADESDPEVLAAAIEEVGQMLAKARKPVILAGVELHRYGLADGVVKLAETLNIPIAADLLSKSTVAEAHPLYLGVYGGAMSSDEATRQYVETADCVLMLGSFITDMNLGIYTAKLNRKHTALITTEECTVGYHKFDQVKFDDFLREIQKLNVPAKQFKHPNPPTEPKPLAKHELQEQLTMPEVMRIVGLNLDENSCVVSDVGDAIFGAVGIRTNARAEFVAPAYYLSMGFAVPAGIGVEKANAKLRAFVLVGDGAFQMTGTELATAIRCGTRPIVIVLNNDGYGTMRQIRDGSFNVISRWNYTKIVELCGGGAEATVATTRGELDGAIKAALGSNRPRVIEVRVDRNDRSPQLAQMSAELARLRNPGKK